MNIKSIFVVATAGVFVALSLNCFAADDLTKLDKNFEVAKVSGIDVVYHDALAAPFSTEGFYWRKQAEPLYRIPLSLKDDQKISGGVRSLAWHTAGGVIRFKTDSDVIVLRTKLGKSWDNSAQPRSGSAGFDLYRHNPDGSSNFVKNIGLTNADIAGGVVVERILLKNAAKNNQDAPAYSLWLPTYSPVTSIEIGVSPNAKILAPDAHKIKLPIVFYGSSITQGAASSRPGSNYAALLARKIDAPLINLGFSGNAKGEPEMAKLVASIDDMAAFVYDYDHNSPTVKALWETHQRFFKIFRKKHPNTPVIILTSFGDWAGYGSDRVKAIVATYNNAVANGDKNVYFLDAHKFFDEPGVSEITADGCHPTDLGFFYMYKNVLPVLQQALQKPDASKK